MDHQTQLLQSIDDAVVTYNVPYKCLIMVSQIEFDENDNIPSGNRIEFFQNMNFFGNGPNGLQSIGTYFGNGVTSAILRAGDRVVVEGIDDFRVTLEIFRMPE